MVGAGVPWTGGDAEGVLCGGTRREGGGRVRVGYGGLYGGILYCF